MEKLAEWMLHKIESELKFEHGCTYFHVQTQGVRTYLEASTGKTTNLENLHNTENQPFNLMHFLICLERESKGFSLIKTAKLLCLIFPPEVSLSCAMQHLYPGLFTPCHVLLHQV